MCNAGIILTDQEVRQLTEAGCEIYRVKWVATEKARICEVKAKMSLFSQSTRVDWLAVEISRQQKDFAQILQLVMWIRTISFAVGAPMPMSPFIHAILPTDTSHGHEIDRILLCRIPAEGVPEEGIAGGEILASRFTVHGTKDAG